VVVLARSPLVAGAGGVDDPGELLGDARRRNAEADTDPDAGAGGAGRAGAGAGLAPATPDGSVDAAPVVHPPVAG
jgi:hypothetical protein